MESATEFLEVDSSSDSSPPGYGYKESSPLKQTKRKAHEKITGPSKKVKEEAVIEKFSSDELHFSTMLPFKNHPNGELFFNKQVNEYEDESPPKHFVTALSNVMKEPTSNQKDPLGIIEAWEKWFSIIPETFGKKNLTTAQRNTKANLDHKFHKYYQLLRCIGCLEIPTRVFCHMACKNGCPRKFQDFNDRPFRVSNMQELEDKLHGRHPNDTWNNMQNSSMHLMLKWNDTDLKQQIAPQMGEDEWNVLTPKLIGVHLTKWFKSLDGLDLEDKFELKESLIPTAGLYRNLNEAVKVPHNNREQTPNKI